MKNRNWQREELIQVLALYCQLPFGQYHHRNPDIGRLSTLLGRSPDAVAMKLSNFASFDPFHQARGVTGLANASQLDRAIWDEFSADWDALAIQSGAITQELVKQAVPLPVKETEDEYPRFPGSTETEQIAKMRLAQRFFRGMILTAYRSTCCVCGLPLPELLIASHIVPWHRAANLRTNPQNGLCLCALHDRAFDTGLFTLGTEFEVILGSGLRQSLSQAFAGISFGAFAGKPISLPDKFIPSQEFLGVHRESIFRG